MSKLVLKTVVGNYGFNFKLKTIVINYGFNLKKILNCNHQPRFLMRTYWFGYFFFFKKRLVVKKNILFWDKTLKIESVQDKMLVTFEFLTHIIHSWTVLLYF